MRRKRDMIVFLVIGIIIGIVIGTNIPGNVPAFERRTVFVDSSASSAEVPVVGIDSDGNGVLASVVAEVRPGTGSVSFDVEQSLKGLYAQSSAVDAVKAAMKHIGADEKRYDVRFTMKADADLIDGPSAGAAMAVATVLALQNKTAYSGVAMTGAIEEDGTITQVGAIQEKAAAAKAGGITTFLVPVGEGTGDNIQRTRDCATNSGFRVCKVRYATEKVDISKRIGINVVEVADLEEALKYFEMRNA